MQSIFFQFLEAEKKNGTTIFFSSHNLSEVQRICDRVGIIKEGRLIKVETVEDIMKTRAKTVRLKTEDEIKPTDDMINFEKVNGYISFVYTGETKKLIHLLSTVNVIDVTITEPALEEIFMHYYEREDQS
jgi:ABC-2 type transport system ATP-binding protein